MNLIDYVALAIITTLVTIIILFIFRKKKNRKSCLQFKGCCDCSKCSLYKDEYDREAKGK